MHQSELQNGNFRRRVVVLQRSIELQSNRKYGVATVNSFERLYRIVFWLFKLSIVFALPKLNTSNRRMYYIYMICFYILNILIYASILSFCVLDSVQMSPSQLPFLVGTSFMIVVSGFGRITLYKNLKCLKKLSKQINGMFVKLDSSIHKNSLFWIRVWITISTGMCVVSMIFSAMNYLPPEALVQANLKIITLYDFLHFIYTNLLVLWLLMPLNVFSIYYVLICLQLQFISSKLIKAVKAPKRVNYEALHQSFDEIKDMVKVADKNLSFLVFLMVVYDASVMYFSILFNLNSDPYYSIYLKCSFYLAFVICFTNFLAMVISASGVHQIFLEISDSARTCGGDSAEPAIVKLLFLRTIDKETAMTVWGIVRVEKSFIFVIFGTLLTYCILIYNMQMEIFEKSGTAIFQSSIF